MITMDMIGRIRRLHVRDKLSEREIARMTGLSRNTVSKWLRAPVAEAPKYRREARPNKLSAFEATLKQALRFAVSEKLLPENTDTAAQANLMMAFVIGRWHQFAKSGFRRDPTEQWAAQWPALV